MVHESEHLLQYYNLNKIFMSMLGQWPYQTKKSEIIGRSIWIFEFLGILIPEFIKFIEIRKNIDYVIKAFSPLGYMIVVGIKFTNGTINRHKIKVTLDTIQSDWKSLHDEEEMEILARYTSVGKLLTFLYTCMAFITLVFYSLLSFTPLFLDIIKPLNESRPKEQIYFVELFIDEDKYFYEIMVHSVIASSFGCFAIIATDTFYACTVQHACGMFSILRHRLNNINKGGDEMKAKSEEETYKETVACAILHDRILEFCDNINLTYTDSFFYIMGFNMISLSFCGLLTIMLWGQINESVKNGVFTAAQVFHLFYYSCQGQLLMDKSVMISESAYNAEWYTASLRIRKILTIVAMRSLKPFLLTAKIFIMSLPNFTLVMKTSMSYFTVLRSTRNI